MPLAPARVPRGARELIAGPQLAAADLRCRDVDVIRSGVEPGKSHETVTLREDVEHAADLCRLYIPLAPPLGLGPRARFSFGLARALFLHGGLPGVVPARLLGIAARAAAPAAPRTRLPLLLLHFLLTLFS